VLALRALPLLLTPLNAEDDCELGRLKDDDCAGRVVAEG
jgi:hypothetical protein